MEAKTSAQNTQVLAEFFYSDKIHASMIAEPRQETKNLTKYY